MVQKFFFNWFFFFQWFHYQVSKYGLLFYWSFFAIHFESWIVIFPQLCGKFPHSWGNIPLFLQLLSLYCFSPCPTSALMKQILESFIYYLSLLLICIFQPFCETVLCSWLEFHVTHGEGPVSFLVFNPSNTFIKCSENKWNIKYSHKFWGFRILFSFMEVLFLICCVIF